MTSEDLKAGLASLGELARAEYRQPLDKVLNDADSQFAALRIGRLIGVLLKQPISSVSERSDPSENTKAYRDWSAPDPAKLRAAAGTWQIKALKLMASEDQPGRPVSLPGVVHWAHNESGFFGYFAENLRKYICGNKAVRKDIEETLEQGRKRAKAIPNATPEDVVAIVGLGLGSLLVQNVPVLGVVGAPAVAAVVLILYKLGVRSFCEWSASAKIRGT